MSLHHDTGDLPDELKSFLAIPEPELDQDMRARLLYHTGVARGRQAPVVGRFFWMWKVSTISMSLLCIVLAVAWIASDNSAVNQSASERKSSKDIAGESTNWLGHALPIESNRNGRTNHQQRLVMTSIRSLAASALPEYDPVKSAGQFPNRDVNATVAPTKIINLITPRKDIGWLVTM